MATFRIEFTPESGIDPQEQSVDAHSVEATKDEYIFNSGRGETVRVVKKEFVRQVVRE